MYGNALVSKPLDFIHISGCRFAVTVRNDGFASIGCTTLPIRKWLEMTFEGQRHITDREEFDAMSKILRPIFEMFVAKLESAKED